VALGDAAHEREAEPHPARVAAARPLEAREALEHPLPLGLGDPGAVVVHREHDLVPLAREAHLDPRAGVPRRVVQQVARDAREVAGVPAHAARAGMRACVFVPAGIERGKILSSAIHGPTVVEVDGSYDEVNRLCAQIGDEHRWAFLNVNMRPYYSEGGKTLAFEVAEQLGWRAPANVVVPIASGNLLVKIHRGFQEFAALGLIPEASTRVHGAQPEGCAPVATAFREGTDAIRPVRPQTIAHSLAIGAPADGRYAIAAVRATGGAIDAAAEDEIVEGIRLLAEAEGIFTETAGGVTIAVLRKLAAAGALDQRGPTVAYITGMGLKTSEAVASALPAAIRIRPSLRAFEEAVLAHAS